MMCNVAIMYVHWHPKTPVGTHAMCATGQKRSVDMVA
jgi:hypothetical protein